MGRDRPIFVSASLQRVRCWLGNQGGMKVKPWAGVEETLDAFHDVLITQRRDEPFWQGLESLLGTLTADTNRRIEARRGEVIDNEVLDPERRRELLGEIRRMLDGRREGKGRFRALASSLSAPAVGLLCMLGSAAAAGCYSATDLQGDGGEARDAAAEQDDGRDAAPDPAADAPDAPRPDYPVPPDVRPEPAPDPAPECDPADATLEEILAECVEDEAMRAYYLECIDAMHASWREGLTRLFACEDCWEVRDQLMNCLEWRCSTAEEQGEFDLESFLDNCAVLIYLGVRFE